MGLLDCKAYRRVVDSTLGGNAARFIIQARFDQETQMAYDKGQAQTIANAINTLANVLAKPTHENWRQAATLQLVATQLWDIAKEIFPNTAFDDSSEEGESR